MSTLISTPASQSPARCPVVLFASERDLWHTNIDGNGAERLTEGNLLTWQPGQGDWWIAFLSNPVQVSPDGRWLTFFRERGRVLVDVTAHAQIGLPMPHAPIGDWSPDSRSFAYGTDDGLYLYDVQKNRTTRLADPLVLGSAETATREVVWSPDGRFIGFACCFTSPPNEPDAWVGQIWKLEVATGQMERVGEIRGYVARTNPLCWTAEGQLAGAEDLADRGQGIRCSYEPPRPMTISPDGNRQAVLNPLMVREAVTGKALWTREVGSKSQIAWSPDGQYLLLDDDSDRSPIWRIQADGSGELEEIVRDGFLLGVVPQWCQP